MKLSNPGIIIQARLGSSRFSNKVLSEIDGKKLIDIVLDECLVTGLKTIVAIPHNDNELYEHLYGFQGGKTIVFRGSENDVISRFYHCAKWADIDPIIRVCADAKNIKADLILQQYHNYAKYKHIVYGNFCEVFSFNELEHYYYNDKRPITREHVSMGMIQDMTVDYEIDLI